METEFVAVLAFVFGFALAMMIAYVYYVGGVSILTPQDENQIVVKFYDDAVSNPYAYTEETIRIRYNNSLSWQGTDIPAAGLYLPATREIYLWRYITEEKTLGHEVCHYMLYRYNITDFEKNEQICYFVSWNYNFKKQVIS